MDSGELVLVCLTTIIVVISGLITALIWMPDYPAKTARGVTRPHRDHYESAFRHRRERLRFNKDNWVPWNTTVWEYRGHEQDQRNLERKARFRVWWPIYGKAPKIQRIKNQWPWAKYKDLNYGVQLAEFRTVLFTGFKVPVEMPKSLGDPIV